jgi:O-antigen/teichoic acid export membrane protein
MNDPETPLVAAPAASGSGPTSVGSKNLDRTLGSLGRGTAVMMAATVIYVVFQFLTRVLVTHSVTGAEWGEFNIGFAIANLLALIAAFGIPTAVARSLAYEETYEARQRLVRRALLVSVPVGIASSILVFLGASDLATLFHNSTYTPIFQLFGISVGFTMLSNVLVGIFQGLERAEPNALFVQIVNPILFLVFSGGLLALHWGFEGVLIGYLLSWVGAFAALVLYTSRQLPPLLRSLSGQAFTGDPTARVSFAALSITLFGVATLSYLTSYADTLLLAFLEPPSVAAVVTGQYSSAMQLTRLLLVGTGTVTFIYLPVTSRLRRQRDFASLRETYVTVTRWMAFLTIPFTFIFAFAPALTLGFTFGSSQVGGADALSILVVANTVAILLGPSTSTLGGLGEVRSVLRWTAVSTVANFALCFLLIPTYGMIGAAIAWSVARLVFPALCLIQVYIQHGITPFRSHFNKPILLTSVVCAALFYAVFTHARGVEIPLMVVIPPLVFAGSILLTRSVDRGDIFVARAAERRFAFVRPFRRVLEQRAAPGLLEGGDWLSGGPSRGAP